MLYNEFLTGTGAPDNLYTYSEYKRIEHIYNNNNSLEKSDAYKMYIAPSGIVADLLAELEEARNQARENANKVISLTHRVDELADELAQEKEAASHARDQAAWNAQMVHNLADTVKHSIDSFLYD